MLRTEKTVSIRSLARGGTEPLHHEGAALQASFYSLSCEGRNRTETDYVTAMDDLVVSIRSLARGGTERGRISANEITVVFLFALLRGAEQNDDIVDQLNIESFYSLSCEGRNRTTSIRPRPPSASFYSLSCEGRNRTQATTKAATISIAFLFALLRGAEQNKVAPNAALLGTPRSFYSLSCEGRNRTEGTLRGVLQR